MSIMLLLALKYKDVILRSFMGPEGIARIVFATIALGMGVNFRDVNDITHYGAPQSIDDYFQESGRCGRSGAPARSVVFWKPRDCPRKRDPCTRRDAEVVAVREYVENTTVCPSSMVIELLRSRMCAAGLGS